MFEIQTEKTKLPKYFYRIFQIQWDEKYFKYGLIFPELEFGAPNVQNLMVRMAFVCPQF